MFLLPIVIYRQRRLGGTEVNMKPEELLRTAYVAFNNRDIDGALAVMHADVARPNGMEGGTVHGNQDATNAFLSAITGCHSAARFHVERECRPHHGCR